VSRGGTIAWAPVTGFHGVCGPVEAAVSAALTGCQAGGAVRAVGSVGANGAVGAAGFGAAAVGFGAAAAGFGAAPDRLGVAAFGFGVAADGFGAAGLGADDAGGVGREPDAEGPVGCSVAWAPIAPRAAYPAASPRVPIGAAAGAAVAGSVGAGATEFAAAGFMAAGVGAAVPGAAPSRFHELRRGNAVPLSCGVTSAARAGSGDPAGVDGAAADVAASNPIGARVSEAAAACGAPAGCGPPVVALGAGTTGIAAVLTGGLPRNERRLGTAAIGWAPVTGAGSEENAGALPKAEGTAGCGAVAGSAGRCPSLASGRLSRSFIGVSRMISGSLAARVTRSGYRPAPTCRAPGTSAARRRHVPQPSAPRGPDRVARTASIRSAACATAIPAGA